LAHQPGRLGCNRPGAGHYRHAQEPGVVVPRNLEFFAGLLDRDARNAEREAPGVTTGGQTDA
jgi:hypothetical protein